MSGDTKESCPAKNSTEAIAWAREHHLRVVVPTVAQLFLDIDSYDDMDILDKNRDLIEEAYGIEDEVKTRSRSGKWHVTITLKKPVTPLERIALQAVLGSDRRREAHSLRRLNEGETTPTIFFERD